MKTLWYGAQAAWWMPLERDARRRYRDRLRVTIAYRVLAYELTDFAVVGDDVPHRLRIEFHAAPSYDSYGLSAEEFPRVYASRLRPFDEAPPGTPTVYRRAGRWKSPHRYVATDGALCMWYPKDPRERRWLPADGLLALIEMAHNHLFAERYHWLHDRWPLDEVPHGFPKVA